LFSDTQLDNEDNINIKYDAAFTSGLDWQELKPAIKADAIRLAIQDEYDLTFTDDFFARAEWQNIYMSLGNGKNDQNEFSSNLVENYDLNIYQFPNTFNKFTAVLRAEVNITSGSSVPYRFVFLSNGERIYESPITTNINQVHFFNYGLLDYGNYEFDYIIESTGIFTADVNTRYQTRVGFAFGGTGSNVVFTETRDTTITTTNPNVILSKVMPDLKVTEWFAAIVKAFNLTIEPLENGDLYVNDIPSWYNSGQIIDVSQYVDIETLDVERGKLYNEIDFGYKDQQSLLAEQYEAQFGQQFGGFEKDLEGIAAEDALKIELPFENPQFERLLPSANQYAFIVDKDFNAYKNAPFLLYIPNLQLTTSNLIGFSGNTYELIENVNTPSHAINLVDGFAAQFNAEFNEYNGGLLADNLYSRFYSDYLNDIFSPQRRQFTINANLPINIATDLRLNDRLIIKGDRYIIDNIDSDLTTGISKLVLLNDLFTSLNVGDISKVSQKSGSFTSSGSIYYTGAKFAQVVTDSDWINLESDNVSSGENIFFTLDNNVKEESRAGIISVIDNLSYPTIIILQNQTII
jgi:hypothetical protein